MQLLRSLRNVRCLTLRDEVVASTASLRMQPAVRPRRVHGSHGRAAAALELRRGGSRRDVPSRGTDTSL